MMQWITKKEFVYLCKGLEFPLRTLMYCDGVIVDFIAKKMDEFGNVAGQLTMWPDEGICKCINFHEGEEKCLGCILYNSEYDFWHATHFMPIEPPVKNHHQHRSE